MTQPKREGTLTYLISYKRLYGSSGLFSKTLVLFAACVDGTMDGAGRGADVIGSDVKRLTQRGYVDVASAADTVAKPASCSTGRRRTSGDVSPPIGGLCARSSPLSFHSHQNRNGRSMSILLVMIWAESFLFPSIEPYTSALRQSMNRDSARAASDETHFFGTSALEGCPSSSSSSSMLTAGRLCRVWYALLFIARPVHNHESLPILPILLLLHFLFVLFIFVVTISLHLLVVRVPNETHRRTPRPARRPREARPGEVLVLSLQYQARLVQKRVQVLLALPLLLCLLDELDLLVDMLCIRRGTRFRQQNLVSRIE
jgi:hypothetical protein